MGLREFCFYFFRQKRNARHHPIRQHRGSSPFVWEPKSIHKRERLLPLAALGQPVDKQCGHKRIILVLGIERLERSERAFGIMQPNHFQVIFLHKIMFPSKTFKL